MTTRDELAEKYAKSVWAPGEMYITHMEQAWRAGWDARDEELTQALEIEQRRVDQLQEKLALAVGALERIGQDDWRYFNIAQEALARIQGTGGKP